MERINLDLNLFAGQARAKAAKLQSARQRQMIEMYIEHTTAEVGSDIDRLMATMNPDPHFHIWVGGSDVGPKGWDGVRAMYLQMFATRANYFEIDIQRLVIDDDCLVKEYIQRTLHPGTNFVGGPWADTLRAQGEEVDPSAYYLTEGRVLITIPFDAQCRILGEDGFTSGRSLVRKFSDRELPEDYSARFLA
jgi:hypothetical protein